MDYQREAHYWSRVHSQGLLSRSKIKQDKPSYTFIYTDQSPPSTSAAVEKLCTDNGMTHGDVLKFNDYRDVETYIVSICHTAVQDEWYSLVSNADDSGSGYLTIPRQILEPVTHHENKFKTIISEATRVNFHLPAHDSFIQSLFGVDAPVEFDYNLTYNWGQREDYICIEKADNIKEFDLNGLTLQTVLEYFKGEDDNEEEEDENS